jgi:hypothetical protein
LHENVPGDFNPRMKLEAARDLDEVDSLDKLIEVEREKEQVKFDAVQGQTCLDYYDRRGICPGMAGVKSGCN